MKIKDMIKELKKIKKEYGNLEVGFEEANGHGNTDISFKTKEVLRYWQNYPSNMVIFKIKG